METQSFLVLVDWLRNECAGYFSHINGPRTTAIPLTEEERQAIEISEQTAQVVTTAPQGAINIIGQDDNGHPIDIHLVCGSPISCLSCLSLPPSPVSIISPLPSVLFPLSHQCYLLSHQYYLPSPVGIVTLSTCVPEYHLAR